MFLNKGIIFSFSLISSFAGAYLLMLGSSENFDIYIVSYVKQNGNPVVVISNSATESTPYYCKYNNIVDEKCVIKKFTEDNPKNSRDTTIEINSFENLAINKKYKLQTTKDIFSSVNLNKNDSVEFEVYSQKEKNKKLCTFKFEYKKNGKNFEGKTNLFLAKAFEIFAEKNATISEYKCKRKDLNVAEQVCEIFKFTPDPNNKQQNNNIKPTSLSINTSTKTTKKEEIELNNYYIIKLTNDVSIIDFLNKTHIFTTFTDNVANTQIKNLASFVIISAMTKNSNFDKQKNNTIFLN